MFAKPNDKSELRSKPAKSRKNTILTQIQLMIENFKQHDYTERKTEVVM